MKIAITADLHYGLSSEGDKSISGLIEFLRNNKPDIILLAGDTGHGEQFEKCLERFESIDTVKLLVAGNHDIWTTEECDNSLEIYEKILPEKCKKHGFLYLDEMPWISSDSRFAIIGNINWYDYSFAHPMIAKKYLHYEMLYRKKFLSPDGYIRHNDGEMAKLGMKDEDFTKYLEDRIIKQIKMISEHVNSIIFASHHPAVFKLFKPLNYNPSDEELIWLAYSGNKRIDNICHTVKKIDMLLSAHTHHSREAKIKKKIAINIGGNYYWKRLLILNYLAKTWEYQDFYP